MSERTTMPRRFLFRSSALAAVLVATAAGAAQASVGGFDGGDGDQAATCPTALDWACLATPAGLYEAVPDSTAPLDDLFVSSSKLDEPDQWAFQSGSASSPKSDVEAVWAAGASPPDGHLLEFAFKVAGGGSSAFVGIELNQRAESYVNATSTPVLCRSDGDLLVSYEIGGGNKLAPNVYRWRVDDGGPSACTGSKGHFEAVPEPTAEQALNSAPVVNLLPVAGFPAGSTFGIGTFGEAAIDLDALAPPNGCTYFNRLQVSSRTSSSPNSNLDDVLPATRLVTAACRREPQGPETPAAPSFASNPVASCAASGGVVELTGTGVAGRTDLEIREASGGGEDPSFTTRATNVSVAGDGTWSTTLSPVADGTHRYVAGYATAAGTTSAERTVDVSCAEQTGPVGVDGGSTDKTPAGPLGPVTGVPAPTPPAEPSPPAAPQARCLFKPFRVSIGRPQARQVRFTVDGRDVGTVRRRRNGRFAIVIDPLKFAPGAHTVRARVLFRGKPEPRLVKLRQFKSCSVRCANRRRFTIRVPKVVGAQVVGAVVRVSGKRRRTIRGVALGRPVRLTRLPKGRWSISITMRTADGRVVRSQRVYRTCSGRTTRPKRSSRQ